MPLRRVDLFQRRLDAHRLQLGDDEGGEVDVGGDRACRHLDAKRILRAVATIVFDYVRRSMPYIQPHSLSDNEVYAVTAYLLNLNGIIGDNDEMNAQTLPKVKMPNQANFIVVYPSRGK